MIQLNFEAQNLTVDWIGFKFQNLDSFAQTKLAEYLFEIGFNSYQESGKLAKPVKESIFVSSKNKFQVLFINGAPYWKGTSVHFSGTNAAFFYSLVKQNLINWEFFPSAILGRLDLNYVRKNKIDDRILVREFLENCRTKLLETNKNVSLEKSSKGQILKIGTRRSNNYSRIYEGKNFLKFEHEMKGKFIKTYHTLLIQNHLEKLERQLSAHFLTYFGKALPLHYSYTDWLVIELRPFRQQFVSQALNSDYMKPKSLQLVADQKTLVTLLQFLKYIRDLDFTTDFLGSTPYRQVSFRLQDFLKYQNPKTKSTNYYQLKKTLIFLQNFQLKTIRMSFSDANFQSLISIPKISLEKSKTCWWASVWVDEELFSYRYPFSLPDFFKPSSKKHDFAVQFEVFQIFNSVNPEKIFLIQEFLENYPSVLSNQQKTEIKRAFIRLVELLKEKKFIENNYKIILNGKFHPVEKLITQNISEGFVIYEKLEFSIDT